ncbi:hypothetical protein BGX31_011120 [Mortierella sp. GBA43]|nr:hypothetical protein BGX31_011120 [Mortierella sp. GBA43]
MATGMGDGILNQSMKADLENWLAALKLSPDSPVHVVGFFGQTNDLSMFERVSSSESESSCNFENDRVVVYHDESLDGQASFNLGLNEPKTTGDIHIYVDRSKNTIMLQHAYLYDTQEMLSACLESMDMVKKDYTSPDMNLDPQMISVLSALSTIKRQIMQELDRFMAICWDRIGVLSPEHHQQNGNGGGGGGHSGRGANSMASIFTPGKCVPVLVFVIERVPVVAPWHEYGASDNQIVEHLKNQVLKKSIDALQTRLRYIFRACRLIQSIDPPAGAFDARQLFVLPGPSSTPFVHVIPHFIGQLDLSDGINSVDDSVLDPAEAVLRQKKTKGHPKKQGPGVNAKNAFMRDNNNNKKSTKNTSSVVAADDDSIFRTPTLKEIYSGVVLARDQPLKQLGINLAGGNSSGSGSSSSNDGTLGESPPLSTLSLGSLYLDFTGPLLKQFVDGWVTNITSPGGYGNTIGKRNTGSVEIPSMKQWMAGLLGVCESLGVTSFSSPVVNRDLGPSITLSSDDLLLNEQEQSSTKENAIGGNKGSKSHSGSTGGRRSGAGKKYSLRCAHLVQKKIQDYIQTDDVMEEL